MEAGVTPNGAVDVQATGEHVVDVAGPAPCWPDVGRVIGKVQAIAMQLCNALVALPGTHTNDTLRLEHLFDAEAIWKATKQDFAKLMPLNRTNLDRISSW